MVWLKSHFRSQKSFCEKEVVVQAEHQRFQRRNGETGSRPCERRMTVPVSVQITPVPLVAESENVINTKEISDLARERKKLQGDVQAALLLVITLELRVE